MSKLNSYLQSKQLVDLQYALKKNESILIEGLWNSPKALIASLAQEATGKHVLILTGGSQEEARLYHDFSYFTDIPILDFPSWETLPSENIAPSPDIVGERYQVLNEVKNSNQPHVIITGLQACLQRLIPPKVFSSLSMVIHVGKKISFNELILNLVEMGYQRCSLAADKGEFAVRGGIIDIFPTSSPDPFRLEFWGDELESIRVYDPIGQKSIRMVESIEIFPGVELELLQRHSHQGTIFDYLGNETLIILDDLVALEDKYASLVSMGCKNKYFSSIEEFLDQLNSMQKIFLSQQPIEEISEVKVESLRGHSYYSQNVSFNRLSFELFNRQWEMDKWTHSFNTIEGYLFEEEEPSSEELLSRLNELDLESAQLNLLASSELEEENFRKKIQEAQITLPKKTFFHRGYLSSGFVLQDIQYILFPFTELSHRYKIRRQKLRSTYHTAPAETYHLLPGELVVHLNNGIGKYLGIEKKSNHLGTLAEFFVIEYAEQAKLYVPVNQAHYISKYIGADDSSPKFHALGSPKWKKTREQTEKAILGYASDLLKSYAQREITPGYIYAPDSRDLKAFEEEFPYTETEDQLEAILSIKEDMASAKSMDRLVCGDVGYGKTEVAMRAAFKAVVDGNKQVAVLVPTTVLAMQHYENFLERMSHFPLTIKVLSRFQSAKEIKEALEGVRNGSVDILIGTHRIISDDVKFKDLGLVIIDEEQRFGVKAKEHLKKIKLGVDCLTLSATPIPRTLYMSLMGARDMSVINTPPQDRLPIKTVIAEPSDEVIKTALLRELSRDGQVFVIHNRVESIYGIANRIKTLLPQARVLVAHGQMGSDEIEATFHAFKKGEADVLVATTIIENGIDIPNANTILIDKADHFGLATLYQVRGRVGRWNRRAYAYFLVQNVSRLSEISRKRLLALTESSGYGGGMRVAMRDLELRGAGNLFGEEQSGHVTSVGFDLYCKLLNQAIRALKGEVPKFLTDSKIELSIDARIPEEYLLEVNLRMQIYQRLGEALTWEEVDEILKELIDRFGKPPEQVEYLYHLTRLRIYASQKGIVLVKQDKLSLLIEKKKGKDVVVRKILAPKYKSAKEMEKKIIEEIDRT